MEDLMEEKKAINKGYKSSNLGWIPNDWEIKKIGKIAKTTAGGTPTTSKPNYWNGNIKWMSSGDLNLKRVFDVQGRISEEGLKNSSTKILPANCILIGLAGQGKTRGTVAMNMVELCTNQSVAAILPSDNYIGDYLYHNLDYRYNELRQLSTGDGGRGGLNLAIINSVKILLPSFPEQKAIADCLSTWDKSIEKLNQLIAQKELRKKGLMQELLTGKKRLSGFEEKSGYIVSEFGLKVPNDWKIVNVDKIFKERTEKSNDQLLYPLYSLTIAQGLTEKTDRYERSFLLKDLEGNQYKIVYPGDILFNPMNLRFGSIAKSTTNLKVLVSAYYNTIYKYSDLINTDYYISLFKTEIYNSFYQRIAIGSLEEKKRVHLSTFMKLEVPLPTLKEQIAIANVLESAYKEIQLLKNKREQLKMQKKGLMQVLLTGKRRLKY